MWVVETHKNRCFEMTLGNEQCGSKMMQAPPLVLFGALEVKVRKEARLQFSQKHNGVVTEELMIQVSQAG